MKTKILNILNKHIVFIIAVMGFSMACNQCAAQYGTLSRHDILKGFVKSEEGLPIRNIRVVQIGKYEDSKGFRFADTSYTVTDSAGYFTYSIRSNTYCPSQLELKFSDIDGEKNGRYLPKDTTVFIKEEEILDINIILKKKD